MKLQDLGFISVSVAQELQQLEREKVLKGESEGIVFLCEHPHTVTLGRKLEKQYDEIKKNIPEGIEVVPLNRGGELTYHGPGQLVIYPVVSLEEKKLSVTQYVSFLETLVSQVLKQYGLETYGKKEHRGVWVNDKKIASVGVHISRGVSIHGIALNVNCDLKYFSYFKPCGLCSTQITSLEKELGYSVPLQEIKQKIALTLEPW